MNRFIQLIDDEGDELYINVSQIILFSRKNKTVYVGLQNGTALHVRQSPEQIYQLIYDAPVAADSPSNQPARRDFSA